MSESIAGSRKNIIVNILLSPDLRVCSTKQKHSVLIKYGWIDSGFAEKIAVEVLVWFERFLPKYLIILFSPILIITDSSSGSNAHWRA